MALWPKEEGKVVAEQSLSARELSIRNIPTRQWFPAERRHCTPKQPSSGVTAPTLPCCSDVGMHALAVAAPGRDEGRFSPAELAHSTNLLSRGSQGCRTCLLARLVPGRLPNVTYFAPRQAASCAALDSVTLEERLLDTGSLRRYGTCF